MNAHIKTSKHLIIRIVIFIVTCLLSASIGWCAGYDFDHRGAAVAFWVGITMWLAIMTAGLPYLSKN